MVAEVAGAETASLGFSFRGIIIGGSGGGSLASPK